MGARNVAQQAKMRRFLVAYAECGNVTQAAEMAGIDRTQHYRWLGTVEGYDPVPGYPEAFAAAGEQAADRLEREAWRRAVNGVERPVYYQGEQCGVVREYSDTLLIFLLKGFRPEKYQERSRMEHTGQVAVTLPELLATLRERRSSGDGGSA